VTSLTQAKDILDQDQAVSALLIVLASLLGMEMMTKLMASSAQTEASMRPSHPVHLVWVVTALAVVGIALIVLEDIVVEMIQAKDIVLEAREDLDVRDLHHMTVLTVDLATALEIASDLVVMDVEIVSEEVMVQEAVVALARD
jgi:predicted membrane protein